MNDDFRKQLYKKMDLMGTDELLDIWQMNDRMEWSETAFDVVQEILVKRIGDLPPQDNAILSHEEELGKDELGLNEWETRLVDSEDQPSFYDTWEVIDVGRKLNKAAKAVLILNILIGVLTFPTTEQIISGYFPEIQKLPGIMFSLFALGLGTALNILLTYFPLKVLAYVLRILAEMEFNSRTTR